MYKSYLVGFDPHYEFHPDNHSEDPDCLTLGELKKIIDLAIDKLGPNIKCMMSYDGTAGYDIIGSVYKERFHDNDVLILSCASMNESKIDIDRKANPLFGIKG